MVDVDTDFAPPPLFGVGWPVLITICLGSLLLYSWISILAWRMVG